MFTGRDDNACSLSSLQWHFVLTHKIVSSRSGKTEEQLNVMINDEVVKK